MCGCYRNKMSWDQLRRLMELAIPDASAAPNMEPDPDIRPTTSQWVIRSTPAGNKATRLRWGLVAYWHGGKSLKDLKLTTFNAKAETVATAASFKGPFARRRCLMPTDGWYEWTGPKGSKQRWTFTAKDGEASRSPSAASGIAARPPTRAWWRASPSSPSWPVRR